MSDLTSASLLFFMLHGCARWDGAAVADAVRSGSLSPLQTEALARLLDGTANNGLKLELRGQGRGLTMTEKAERYDRIIAVGAYVSELISQGETWEAAVIEAAGNFGLSEPTIARDLAFYRGIDDEGQSPITHPDC